MLSLPGEKCSLDSQKNPAVRATWLEFEPTTYGGRGQPLSFTLSFGEIPWFDEEG